MPRSPHWLPVTSRIFGAVLGGYVFTWGFSALIVALNLAGGGEYDEGVTLAYLIAFIVYLSAFLWAFAAASLKRIWLTLAGGGAVMTVAAWGLTQALTISH